MCLCILAVQRSIRTADYSEGASGIRPEDARQPPVTGQSVHPATGKVRHANDPSRIHQVPDVRRRGRAIAAIAFARWSQVHAISRRTLQESAATDRCPKAVGPRIVGSHRDTFAEAFLCIQQQRVVAPGAAVIPRTDVAELLPLDRIKQSGYAAVVCIGGRGTEGVWCRRKRVALSETLPVGAGVTREVDCRIQLAGPVQMHKLISDIVRRYEPVVPKLSLDSKVPLLHIRLVRVVFKGSKDAAIRIRHILA